MGQAIESMIAGATVDSPVALGVHHDPHIFSDSSGMSNKDKWEYVTSVFDCDDCDLFSDFSFEDIYKVDHTVMAEAGWYIADLRTQFFRTFCADNPLDAEAHREYMENLRWMVKFRERVSLSRLMSALPRNRLT